ncbi:spinster homolog 1 [Pelobates cultripes]|uniref:Protein spinster homolog 1 n=1 Tax=Pelobates cultripes TaxID=61616 RepID=A0AAD1TAX3_PELCU|nr:spinster homolog 1 [Pelobates cultripes]
MSKKDVTCFWIVLLLCQELRTDPIAEMGPSSGILIQETPGFILTEKRILTRRVFVSLDPKISIEKAYNISSMQLPELQTWYQMHLQRAQDRVRNILEQARKPFVSSSIPMSNRPKRFLTAIIVALVCATVGAVVATGMSAANSITVQKLDMEIYALKQHINDIHQVINQQRTLLQDVLTIVEDTVVTTNLHSELIAKSTELHQSHDLFKRELLFLHDPILFHTLAFLDEVQTGMIELAGGRIPLYFVSKDIVHAMLANVDGETIEPMQLNLAFEMGSAIPLLIDPERVLPVIANDFGIKDSDSGLVQTVFICSHMVFAPVFGYLGDRYNRKYIIGGGIAFWSLITLSSSFITKENYWLLLITRGLVGVGQASYSTIAPTLIADLFLHDERSRMLSFFYLATPVGCGLGYIAGSKVSSVAGGDWHWALRVSERKKAPDIVSLGGWHIVWGFFAFSYTI